MQEDSYEVRYLMDNEINSLKGVSYEILEGGHLVKITERSDYNTKTNSFKETGSIIPISQIKIIKFIEHFEAELEEEEFEMSIEDQ